MTFDWRTKLRRYVLNGSMILFLANCQPMQSLPVEVAAPLPLETIKSLCLAWFNSLPTWQDSDAEQTKDEIDYAIRLHEAQCDRFLKGE
ncbi:MAG: hypothetical protein HC888_01505 [Candidatus Competibacteraceae bacterium]|nr:hypothetical protein [Candidatus Competibacteraceae bacterium]